MKKPVSIKLKSKCKIFEHTSSSVNLFRAEEGWYVFGIQAQMFPWPRAANKSGRFATVYLSQLFRLSIVSFIFSEQ